MLEVAILLMTYLSQNVESNQKLNNDKCRCECKKYNICGNDYIWNRAACSCKNGKNLASIMDDSAFDYV